LTRSRSPSTDELRALQRERLRSTIQHPNADVAHAFVERALEIGFAEPGMRAYASTFG